MRSIRRRLLLSLLIGLGVLLAAGGFVLTAVVRETLEDGLDETLRARAAALAGHLVIEVDPVHRRRIEQLGARVFSQVEDGGTGSSADREALMDLARRAFRVRLRREAGRLPGYARRDGGAYFRVALADGTEVARSPSLGDRALDGPPGAGAEDRWDLDLGADRPVRVASLRVEGIGFADASWSRAWERIRQGERIDVAAARVFVAADRSDVDALVGALGTALVAVSTVLLLGAGALVVLAGRRALGPLVQLERQVRQLDPGALHERIALRETPRELSAVVAGLNDALARLEAGFARERSTAAHLSHELRTPLAELQAVTEVALRWPDDEELQARCVRQSHEIAVQMRRIVSALLRVARAESGDAGLDPRSLDLRELLEQAWDRLRAASGRHDHAFEVDPSCNLHVRGDHDVTDAVLSSLLQNALAHAPAGSTVRACALAADGEVTLDLSNPCEPGDPREGGLGLALVERLTRAAGMRLEAGAVDGAFRARLHLPVVATAG